MSGKTGKPWAVLLGAIAGFALVTLISVFLGAALAKHIRPEYIRCAGAAAFVVIGLLMFLNKF